MISKLLLGSAPTWGAGNQRKGEGKERVGTPKTISERAPSVGVDVAVAVAVGL